jgi:hypothetical protein
VGFDEQCDKFAMERAKLCGRQNRCSGPSALAPNFSYSRPQRNFVLLLTARHDLNSNTLSPYNVASMENEKSIGIIGMGDMGKMYARRLSDAGWK